MTPVPAVPSAVRDDTVDELHGVRVADPYRYLEDPDADRTRAFVRAQNAVSAPYLAGLPAAERFRESVLQLLTRPRAGTPWERGGRYFRMDNPGENDQDRFTTAPDLDALLTAPRVLLDPATLSADGTVAVNGLSVSPDGSLVAVALSEAGSDWQTIRVLRTDPDAVDGGPDDVLEWSKFLAPVWLPDSSGLLYWRYPRPAGRQFVEEMPAGELALHLLGTGQHEDTVVWARPDAEGAAHWTVFPEFSSDDRWLLLTASPGTDSRTVLQICPVVDGRPGEIRDVIADLVDAHHPIDVVDDVLLLHTERDAPRGRIVAVDLERQGPDGPGDFRELLAQDPDDLLVTAAPAGGRLLVVTSQDTAHRLRLVGLDGVTVAELPLPYPSSVTALHARAASPEFFVGTTSFTTRLEIRRGVLDAAADVVSVTPVAALPPGAAAVPGGVPITAERRHGTSADGTRVPMTVVRRADAPADGPTPTLLYGYGGFDIPMLPSFSALFSAWVQAGGVFAVANLRGGGEFGRTWHQAGMGHHKQRVFDDLYGCAEALIADGTTTADRLAVHGRSNGGLLVGAALTQRPELWAATLPTVGVMDMLRFHRFTIGAAWTTEYGDPDDAADFAAIHAYSPLHRLVEGTAYPPTLICTGDHDDRVVPAHSLKFGAEMQHCQAGDAPVLLRVDTRAGHGAGKPIRALAAEYADQLSFAAAHTGLEP